MTADVDPAAIRARHEQQTSTITMEQGAVGGYCLRCRMPWPCDVIRALGWGEQMQAERDSARDLAVALEQRVAVLNDLIGDMLAFDLDLDPSYVQARASRYDFDAWLQWKAIATPAEPTP